MASGNVMAFPHPSPLSPHAILKLGGFSLSRERPLIMGIVNITPDSFSDGGKYLDPGRALDHARQLLDEGADILDIGGESSRPGAGPVTVDEELRRVLPVLEKHLEVPGPGSGGTCQPGGMRPALAARAAIVNHILSVRSDRALRA